MLRLKHSIRIQLEGPKKQAVLLFPEGIVDLNRTAYTILSKLPKSRTDLEHELCENFSTRKPLSGFHEFLDTAIHSNWIYEDKK